MEVGDRLENPTGGMFRPSLNLVILGRGEVRFAEECSGADAVLSCIKFECWSEGLDDILGDILIGLVYISAFDALSVLNGDDADRTDKCSIFGIGELESDGNEDVDEDDRA